MAAVATDTAARAGLPIVAALSVASPVAAGPLTISSSRLASPALGAEITNPPGCAVRPGFNEKRDTGYARVRAGSAFCVRCLLKSESASPISMVSSDHLMLTSAVTQIEDSEMPTSWFLERTACVSMTRPTV